MTGEFHMADLTSFMDDEQIQANDMAAAKADLQAYAHNLARFGGEGCCLAIERAWGLEGYPPEIVSGVLADVASGWSVAGAIANATGHP